MAFTYLLNADEIDERFIKVIQILFKGKRISITIDEETDETEYLLKSEINRVHLLKALKDANEGKNLITFKSAKDLEKAVYNAAN